MAKKKVCYGMREINNFTEMKKQKTKKQSWNYLKIVDK
jgi:hypothetical protein